MSNADFKKNEENERKKKIQNMPHMRTLQFEISKKILNTRDDF